MQNITVGQHTFLSSSFFFLNEYSSVYVGGCSKESAIIMLLYYHFICWYFRFDSCLKFMPLSEKLLPRFFLSLRPKVGSQSPVHVAGFGGGGGEEKWNPCFFYQGAHHFCLNWPARSANP